MTKLKDIFCPNCGKKDTWTPTNKYKPFCSERCKIIDLGGWAAEQYRVAGDPADKVKDEDDSESE